MYKDFMYYEWSHYLCRFRINAKVKFPYVLPRNFNLEHFASVLFKKFPEGLNAGEIVIRLFHDRRLVTSKKTVQVILAQIRSRAVLLLDQFKLMKLCGLMLTWTSIESYLFTKDNYGLWGSLKSILVKLGYIMRKIEPSPH